MRLTRRYLILLSKYWEEMKTRSERGGIHDDEGIAVSCAWSVGERGWVWHGMLRLDWSGMI